MNLFINLFMPCYVWTDQSDCFISGQYDIILYVYTVVHMESSYIILILIFEIVNMNRLYLYTHYNCTMYCLDIYFNFLPRSRHLGDVNQEIIQISRSALLSISAQLFSEATDNGDSVTSVRRIFDIPSLTVISLIIYNVFNCDIGQYLSQTQYMY